MGCLRKLSCYFGSYCNTRLESVFCLRSETSDCQRISGCKITSCVCSSVSFCHFSLNMLKLRNSLLRSAAALLTPRAQVSLLPPTDQNKHKLTSNKHKLTINKHKLTSNKHKLTINKHKLTSKKHKLTINKHKLTSNKHRLTSNKHKRALCDSVCS